MPLRSLCCRGRNPLRGKWGSLAEATTAVVSVVGLNLLNESVTVQTQDGKLVDVRAKSVDNLKQLRLGDKILVTYFASLAVSVESIAPRGVE